jgi:hypothetical protein
MKRSLYWAGIAIPLLVIALIGIINSSDEPNVTITINTQVQDYAQQHNISIAKAADVTNMFVRGVGFGGAGGIADLQIDYIDVNAFIGELEKNSNLDTIRYEEIYITDTKLMRTYYAFSSKNAAGFVAADSQWYDSRWWNKPNFAPVDTNLTTITYAKMAWYKADILWIALLIVILLIWIFRCAVD